MWTGRKFGRWRPVQGRCRAVTWWWEASFGSRKGADLWTRNGGHVSRGTPWPMLWYNDAWQQEPRSEHDSSPPGRQEQAPPGGGGGMARVQRVCVPEAGEEAFQTRISSLVGLSPRLCLTRRTPLGLVFTPRRRARRPHACARRGKK
jgi:hypothetical protein